MKLIITIDTEADNQWEENGLSLENIKYLPRFQKLCEKFSFPPTYLVTYEVADNRNSVDVLRPWQEDGLAEIGAHFHPWTTPPYYDKENKYLFLTELPDDILEKQLFNLTEKITHSFGRSPLSFRGGRWSFDKRAQKILFQLGYLVDCSFTPKIDWREIIKRGNKQYAPNYKNSPVYPFYLDDDNKILEVPMTIIYTHFFTEKIPKVENFISGLPYSLRKIADKILGLHWLRIYPQTSSGELKMVYKTAKRRGLGVLEFMAHSSELMPGGSPYSKTEEDVEHFYQVLEEFFVYLKNENVRGVTLSEFAKNYKVEQEKI